MKDLAIRMDNHPGALAAVGEALARAGVNIEGGGGFVCSGGTAEAHFLFTNGIAAQEALEEAGIQVLAVRDVLIQSLDPDRPGELGKLARAMAEAGVNIEVAYTIQQNRLVLVVNDPVRGKSATDAWNRARSAR